jgi:hypothetical protein
LRVDENGVDDLKLLNVNSEFVFEQRFFLLAKKLKIFSRDYAFVLQNVPFHCEFFCNDFSLVFHIFNERRSESVDKTAWKAGEIDFALIFESESNWEFSIFCLNDSLLMVDESVGVNVHFRVFEMTIWLQGVALNDKSAFLLVFDCNISLIFELGTLDSQILSSIQLGFKKNSDIWILAHKEAVFSEFKSWTPTKNQVPLVNPHSANPKKGLFFQYH